MNEFLNWVNENAPVVGSVLGAGFVAFASLAVKTVRNKISHFLTPSNVVGVLEHLIDDYSKNPEELEKVLRGFEKSGMISQGVATLRLMLNQKIDEMEDRILTWQDKLANGLTSDEAKAREIIKNYHDDIEKYRAILKATDEKHSS